jgi:hypothetical protein
MAAPDAATQGNADPGREGPARNYLNYSGNVRTANCWSSAGTANANQKPTPELSRWQGEPATNLQHRVARV